MKNEKASSSQLRSLGATFLLTLAGVVSPVLDAMTCECTASSKYDYLYVDDGINTYGSCNANKEYKTTVEREYTDCSAENAGADIDWTDTCDPKSPALGLPWHAGYVVFMFSSKGYYDSEYTRFACPLDPYDKMLKCHSQYDQGNFSKRKGRIVVKCVAKNPPPAKAAAKDAPEGESLVGEGDNSVIPGNPSDGALDDANRPVTH